MTKQEKILKRALEMAVKHMIWSPTKCPNKKDKCKEPGITLAKYCKGCYIDHFIRKAKEDTNA